MKKPSLEFTQEQKAYIVETLKDWTFKDALYLFNDKYGLNVSYWVFVNICHRNGIFRKNQVKWTYELVNFVRNNPHFRNKELAKMISKRFGVQANDSLVMNIKAKVRRENICG